MWYEFYICTHEREDGRVLSFVPLKLHDEQWEKKGKRKTILQAISKIIITDHAWNKIIPATAIKSQDYHNTR